MWNFAVHSSVYTITAHILYCSKGRFAVTWTLLLCAATLLVSSHCLWLMQAADELPRAHKDPVNLLAAGKWISAPQLVQLIHSAQQRAELDLQQQGVTADTSRQLHDAALAGLTFSHLPPVRLSCLRGLLVPSYQGPCVHPDCKLPGCEGNRLYVISESPLLMRIKLPHHKNARKWGQASIEIEVPSDLAELLHTYLGAPRAALLAHHKVTEQSCPQVLMDMHGRGFGDTVFTLYWQNWLDKHGAVRMNPSMCRQVFVDERQSNNAVAGPSKQGAAMVMGHSLQQWHKWYDMEYHSRLAQDAVDAMQSWRAAMLEVSVPSSKLSLSRAPHCQHVIVSESEGPEYLSCSSGMQESDLGLDLD